MPVHQWIFSHMIWDTAGAAGEGSWRTFWAVRKLLLAILGAVLLTWVEWVEHHPPEIALIAVIHFVFVFSAIGAVVYIRARLRRR
jgi:hypothetical protein